jgi:MoaA/NifB/PqqE/SkfB family radical SAM enzyme
MIKDPYDKLAIRKASVCMFTEIKGRRVTWEITGYCNLRCKHCCINANENFKVFPDFEEVKRIIEEMKEIKVKAIYISGGEPLLWENIYNFIHYSKDVGIEVLSLSTNGVCITPLTAKKLKEAWIDKIQISLDHYEEEKIICLEEVI